MVIFTILKNIKNGWGSHLLIVCSMKLQFMTGKQPLGGQYGVGMMLRNKKINSSSCSISMTGNSPEKKKTGNAVTVFFPY